MKFLIICLAVLASSAAYDVELLNEQQWENFMQNNTISPETRGLILNSQAKKAVRNTLQQMPCGWPEYGIPPMAPYTNPDLAVHLKKSVIDAFLQFIRLRYDGLDQMEIRKLKVSFTFVKKVKFHFCFKKLSATSALYNTNIFLDLKKWGFDLRYEGSGPMEFHLNNLCFEGQFKYKAPLILGSVKIYKFKVVVRLESVDSKIGNLLGNGKYNAFANRQIEYLIPAFIKVYQTEISSRIEENLVPRVNARMKGKKIWTLLGMLGGSSRKCVPTPAPWLSEDEERATKNYVN